MEELERNGDQVSQNVNEIGDVVINYDGRDTLYGCIPIVLNDGQICLITNFLGWGEKSRIEIQDLNGNTIKELLHLGFETAEITADNNNIYIFTRNTRNPMFYIFDKKTFDLKMKNSLGNSIIHSVCCKENEICTFDIENGEIQYRDKNGNIISKRYAENNERFTEDIIVYSARDGFHFARYRDIKINEDYRRECEEKFGKDIMDLNNKRVDEIAFDESSQTKFVASKNIICVSTKDEMKGVMYFPDKDIVSISVDPRTHSLIVCSVNKSDFGKSSYDEGGTLEIIPLSTVLDRIKSSETFLTQRKKLIELCHRIADEVYGDIDKMIILLQAINKEIKNHSNDEGGTLEILPSSMTLDQIRSPEIDLVQMIEINKACHKIVDEAHGDIDKMINSLQTLNKEIKPDDENRESVKIDDGIEEETKPDNMGQNDSKKDNNDSGKNRESVKIDEGIKEEIKPDNMRQNGSKKDNSKVKSEAPKGRNGIYKNLSSQAKKTIENHGFNLIRDAHMDGGYMTVFINPNSYHILTIVTGLKENPGVIFATVWDRINDRRFDLNRIDGIYVDNLGRAQFDTEDDLIDFVDVLIEKIKSTSIIC